MLADRQPYGIAGLRSTWFENNQPKFSFTTFTVEPNDFMLPIHPQAMPVILDSPRSEDNGSSKVIAICLSLIKVK